MVWACTKNTFAVRTATLDLPDLFAKGYKKLREYSWEIAGTTTTGDSDIQVAATEYPITEPALLVAYKVLGNAKVGGVPASDFEISSFAIVNIGVTGGSIELDEARAFFSEFVISTITQFMPGTVDNYRVEYGVRWPLDDGDILSPRLQYGNTGITLGSHYAEFKLWVAEKS